MSEQNVKMKQVYRYVISFMSKRLNFHFHQGRTTKMLILLFLGCIPFLVTNCKKEPDPAAPLLSFITDSTYVFQDTELKAGAPFYLGLNAEMGGNTLTNLYIARYHEGGMEVIVDSGIHNETLTYRRIFNKGVYDEELWKFRVKDMAGKWAEVSFTLRTIPGSTYDSVQTVPSIMLGAQQCSTHGSFLDVRNMVVYFQDAAFSVQDSIEMLYYYDPSGDYNTIASPGANVDATIYTGISGLSYWTVKNETRFIETTISPAQFDAVVHDSLLIVSYDQLTAKRKAKNLMTGEVYSFKTASGKFGLFKVLNVAGAETGTVECAIKIQP